MSTGAARVIRRIVTAAGAAGGALALLGSMGLSSAYAEPTPNPDADLERHADAHPDLIEPGAVSR